MEKLLGKKMCERQKETVPAAPPTVPPVTGQSTQTTAAQQLTVPHALETHTHARTHTHTHTTGYSSSCRQGRVVLLYAYTAQTHLPQQSTAVKCITLYPVCNLTEVSLSLSLSLTDTHTHTHTHKGPTTAHI